MDIPSSKRQEKRDAKKKRDANAIYTAKHVRIAAEIAEKNSNTKMVIPLKNQK